MLAFALPAAGPALAQEALRGVALVVGNGGYEHLAPLANPAQDARVIERLLADLGFETELASDRDARRLARDLRDFIEDAEGADVAVLYYAGHGIEAGGENWLVPVDADVSALDDAAAKLVPLSRIVAELQASVGVTIVLLDACRDNPFPPDAMLKLASGAAAPVSAGGLSLGDARGATRLAPASAPADGNLGTVIGFAAEPGRVALDGAPGGNSPYAAALVRHLAALSGAEFGQVMRMVGEEVYLKTGGRQRPWVNESLRRLLYFGEAPATPAGDEGDMLAERRQLLMTIAALPDLERRTVERAAAEGGVPMDALYGMLRAMGSKVPDDPAQLEELLRGEAERFARVLAEREALNSPDAELMRLSALADTAEAEGLLTKAGELRERAKARFREIEGTLERQQAALDRRFVEGAAVFARSAQTRALAFDHLGAAADYAEALRLVDGRDARLAWEYANSELLALTEHGRNSGDRSALELAVSKGPSLSRRAEALEDGWNRGAAFNNLGNALVALADLDGRVDRLAAAGDAYRAAVENWPVTKYAGDWAMAQSNIGNVLRRLGSRTGDMKLLNEAATALVAALQVRTRERTPGLWADTQTNLGSVMLSIGRQQTGTASFETAVAAFRAAAGIRSRESDPRIWATLQNNLGIALNELGMRTGNAWLITQAIEALRLALEERTRDRLPVEWAQTQVNLGSALYSLAVQTGDASHLREGEAALRLALSELTRERIPQDWAHAQSVLGNLHLALGIVETGVESLSRAVAAFDAALEVFGREEAVDNWSHVQTSRGMALSLMGQRTADASVLREAVAALEGALAERSRERVPAQWATTGKSLGTALLRLGYIEAGTASLDRAIDVLRPVASAADPVQARDEWMELNGLLAAAYKIAMDRAGDRSETYLEGLVGVLREVQDHSSREEAPESWAANHNDLGYNLALLAERQGDAAKIGEAVAILRESLAVLRERDAGTLPFVADSLCTALRISGEMQHRHDVLVEARSYCRMSVAGLEAADNPLASQAAANLEKVDAAIAALAEAR